MFTSTTSLQQLTPILIELSSDRLNSPCCCYCIGLAFSVGKLILAKEPVHEQIILPPLEPSPPSYLEENFFFAILSTQNRTFLMGLPTIRINITSHLPPSYIINYLSLVFNLPATDSRTTSITHITSVGRPSSIQQTTNHPYELHVPARDKSKSHSLNPAPLQSHL